MAQEKPDILKALEEEVKRDEGAKPKATASAAPATAAQTAAKTGAPAKHNTLLDALLNDARAEADREIQQHNQRLQQRVDGQRKAEEEEERRKRLQYEQLFEEEKRKRQDVVRKKEEERIRKEREIQLAEQRRLEEIARKEAAQRARRLRIYVGSGIAGALAIFAILVFTGVIPLLPTEKIVGTRHIAKDTGYEPPAPFQGVVYQPTKGDPLFVTTEKPKLPDTEGAGIEVLNAVRQSGFQVNSSMPQPATTAPGEELRGTAQRLANSIARDFKVEKAPGPDNSIKIKDIFK